VICGYRLEEVEEPLMQKISYLDKLVAAGATPVGEVVADQ
jgi:hypothetical protein